MYKSYLSREFQNLGLLRKYAAEFGTQVFVWSLLDGACRRLHVQPVYERTNRRRYDECKRVLKERYGYVLDRYRDVDVSSVIKVGSDSCVWRYWHQGAGNAPYPVDVTLRSTDGRCRGHEVITLDKDTYGRYVDVPGYIVDHLDRGDMNIAVFSDYLRLSLLREYGGIWLDSTFLMTDVLPEDVDGMAFYSIRRAQRRDWVVTRDLWSVCLLACGPGNPLISFCQDFLTEYWQHESAPIGYLMTDCIIALAYDEISQIREMVDAVPDNNTHCFDFLTPMRNEPADDELLRRMRQDTYVWQLSYKYGYDTHTRDGRVTNFGRLIQMVGESTTGDMATGRHAEKRGRDK